MEDEELGEHWGKRPDDLIAWAIGPVREGWLTLRLRHAGEETRLRRLWRWQFPRRPRYILLRN